MPWISSPQDVSTAWLHGRTGGSSTYRSPLRSRCPTASTPTGLWCGRRAAWGSVLGMPDLADASKQSALWGVCLAFYGKRRVAEALIALQDRAELDVNLVLFALWLGVSGRGRLSRAGLEAADRAICRIRGELVAPLRALRRRLKDH